MKQKINVSEVIVRLNLLEREMREVKGELIKITEITKPDQELIKTYYSQEQYEGMLTSTEFRKIEILNLLKEREDMAFKPVELARTLKMPQQKVNRALRTLVREERIIHKSPYYIINKEVN